MRILWLTSAFHPQMGGVITYVDRLTNHLALQGHTVGLVTSGGQTRPASDVAHFTVPFLDGPSEAQVPKVEQDIAAIIARFRPDIVHLTSAGLAVFSAAFPPDVPIVATIHGNDLSKPWQGWPRGDAGSAIVAGLARCAEIFCVSRHTRGLALTKGLQAPLSIVHNACDIEAFAARPGNSRAVLRRYGIDPDQTIVLTVARLVPRKGHLEAMRAMRQVRKPLHWIIVGEGRCFAEIRRSSLASGQRQRVSLLGRVSATALLDLYNACDFFLLTPFEIRTRTTFDSEGFGLVYLEAGACGKASIASTTAGCSEAVADERTGLLVPPGSAPRLAAAICRLIDDPILRRRLGDNAQRRIRASGGWSAVARTLSQSYARIVAATPPAEYSWTDYALSSDARCISAPRAS
jgi:phosphatidyl-myo-inositol dimannoside synthase